MTNNTTTVITILLMAVVTYTTRIAGPAVLSRIPMTPRLRSALAAIPGAVLISLIAPTVFTQGFAEAGAALVTLLVASRNANLLVSILAGVAAVSLLRLV